MRSSNACSRQILSVVAVAAIGVSQATPQAWSQHDYGAITTAKAISDHAKGVVYGRVRSVRPTSYSSPQLGILRFETRTVEIEVEPLYQPGSLSAQLEIIELQELASSARALEPNEKVLWFLAKKSSYGFQHTVALRAGDFRVVPDPSDRARQVVFNGLKNEGLWEKDSFWDGSDFAKDIKAKLFSRWSSEIAWHAYRAVNKKCCSEHVPLEIVLAVAAAKFNTPNSTVER